MGSRDDRDREAARKRRAELDRQAAEWAKFERENQPRDAEEKRNAEAEDKHLADNFKGILDAAARMDDKTFERYVSKGSNKRKIRKTGKSVGQLRRARKAKRSSLCGLLAVLLLAVAVLETAVVVSGLHELASAVLP